MRASSKTGATRVVLLLCAACLLPLAAQTPPVPQSPQPAQAEPATAGPIAIVPLSAQDPNSAATVTGALEVTAGKAIIAASGSVTSGDSTTTVILPHRGVLRVCAATTVKLAADSSVPAGETPGLLMAMDHGAIETSFATGRNADILLTPDFRILIAGPGSSDLKIRLGRDGDTCVDNSPSDRSSSLESNPGPNAPYVVVTSLFDPGLYRVQPGQRVMFQHGSLHEVVDREQEPCGCPPPAKTASNEFPLAQSEGLAPTPAPAPMPKQPTNLAPQTTAPLVYSSAARAPQPAPMPSSEETAPATAPSSAANPPASPKPAKKKPGLFIRLGHLFRRIFGAES